MEASLKKCFNDDQLEALKLPANSKNNHWSNDTVMSALKIRSGTGVQGYNLLRKLGYPLPSYRTLCNRVVSIDMRAGIQTLTLDWMEVKIPGERNEKLCSLLLDEVQIAKAIEYDLGLKEFVGHISPELAGKEPEGSIASHVLVYMVKGVTTKWKQVIAYFYTGKSVNGSRLWNLTKQVIVDLSRRGFMVTTVVSDMGASNQAMWKAAGIVSTRHAVNCKIGHPFFADRFLHFISDVPHLIKNLRSAFLKHQILLPPALASKYGLPSSEVDSSHVKELVKQQEEKELKLAPKLTPRHVQPSQYEKMRVNMASQVLSHSTAAALRTLVIQHELPQKALTTAFFCEYFNSFFDIMNCRCSKTALFEDSEQRISQLKEVLHLVQNLMFPQSLWKPVQTGLQLSICSLLSLHQELVVNGDLAYLMTGRFTQDALENLFSQVRGFGSAHPNPTQFRSALKLIVVGQLLEVPSNSSYDEDDTPHLLSFIREHDPQPQTVPTCDATAFDMLVEAASCTLDTCESNGLYYVVGWALFKELQKVTCDACQFAFTSRQELIPSQCPSATLTLLKSYNSRSNFTIDQITHYLCHPSPQVFEFFQSVEAMFRANVAILKLARNPLLGLMGKVCFQGGHVFPECHSILKKTSERFLKLRLHIHAKQLSKALTEKQFASKSAARANIK